MTADLAHREQVEILSELLTGRDALAKSLGGKLVDLRRVCLGLFDEEELIRLGLGGAVSQDPVVIHRQGQKAWLRFQNLEQLKTPKWLEVEVKVETLVSGLGTGSSRRLYPRPEGGSTVVGSRYLTPGVLGT